MDIRIEESQSTEKVLIDGEKTLRFVAPAVQFKKRVEILNSVIETLDICGAYFLGGLELINCRIKCSVLWQYGGHNRNQSPIRIENCVFEEFVDFEDCWFESAVTLKNVVFKKGSNLLANKGTPVEVTFDVAPELIEVEGDLGIDTFPPRSG